MSTGVPGPALSADGPRWRVEELARRTDVSVDTIRFYQKRQLLPAPRREGRIAWYGADHVAQIVTFSTIKARAAVRDGARVLDYPYALGDKIAKLMPPLVMGRDTPLKYCFEVSPKYADGYKAAAELRRQHGR